MATAGINNESIILKMSNELQCLKCDKLLEEPKILPCLHTICKTCVDDLVEQTGDFDEHGNVTFQCPKGDCEDDCKIDGNSTSDNLKTNELVKNMLGILARTNNARICQGNEDCKDAIDKYCSSCETKLCSSCLRSHNCDREALVPIIFDPESSQWLLLCKEHGVRGTSVCYDCGEKVLCTFCFHRGHRSHHKASVKEYATETKNSFVSLLQHAKPRFSEFEICYDDEIDIMESFRENLAKELHLRKKAQLNMFYEKLTTEENRLLKEVDLKIADFSNKVSRSNLREHNHAEAITAFIQDVSQKSDSSIVMERKSVLETIDDLSSIHCFTGSLTKKIIDTELLGHLDVKVFKKNDTDIISTGVTTINIESIEDEADQSKLTMGNFPGSKESLDPWRIELYRHFHEITKEILTKVQPSYEDVCNYMDNHDYITLWSLLQMNKETSNLRNEDGNTILIYACEKGYSTFVDLLLNNGADAVACRGVVETALMVAAKNGDFACMEVLLKNHADVNVVASSGVPPIDRTALHLASANGRLPCLSLLLQHNAIVDVRDSYDETPLHDAARKGNLECINMLLKHDAGVNVTNCSNETALHLASDKGHASCVKTLMKSGADVNIRNDNNQRAIDCTKNLTIRRLLKKAQNIPQL